MTMLEAGAGCGAPVTGVNLGGPLAGWDVAGPAREANDRLPVVSRTGAGALDAGVPSS